MVHLCPVTCTVNCKRYEGLLSNYVIPIHQQQTCLDEIFLTHDGAPMHFVNSVIQLIKRRFRNDRIISYYFQTAWPSKLPDLNSSDFWLQGYLNNIAMSGLIVNLP